jgi:hypothetical protein
MFPTSVGTCLQRMKKARSRRLVVPELAGSKLGMLVHRCPKMHRMQTSIKYPAYSVWVAMKRTATTLLDQQTQGNGDSPSDKDPKKTASEPSADSNEAREANMVPRWSSSIEKDKGTTEDSTDCCG